MLIYKLNAILQIQGLFRNLGPRLLPSLKPHVERAIHERDPQRIEHCQLVACEIFAGLIRGAKYWPYEDVSIIPFSA